MLKNQVTVTPEFVISWAIAQLFNFPASEYFDKNILLHLSQV